MRDLDQLHERLPEQAPEEREPNGPQASSNTGARLRRLALLSLAGLMTIVVVSFSMVSGGSGSSEQIAPVEPVDPFLELGLTGGLHADAGTQHDLRVEGLSFPATLVGDQGSLDEHGRAAPRKRMRAEDVPANTLATEQSDRLLRAAKHDPLVAQSLPDRGGAVVPAGMDGPFTLQVSSYETRDAAERFATSLRARGHRAFVNQAELPAGRGRSYRVRIGPFTTRREALEYQARFERQERMHGILVTSTPTH